MSCLAYFTNSESFSEMEMPEHASILTLSALKTTKKSMSSTSTAKGEEKISLKKVSSCSAKAKNYVEITSGDLYYSKEFK
jgi:hypothetical protein